MMMRRMGACYRLFITACNYMHKTIMNGACVEEFNHGPLAGPSQPGSCNHDLVLR